eukprot:s734_g10.t2
MSDLRDFSLPQMAPPVVPQGLITPRQRLGCFNLRVIACGFVFIAFVAYRMATAEPFECLLGRGVEEERYRDEKARASRACTELADAWANPGAQMRARALSLHSPVDGWSVASLHLFADVECTMEVRGFAISSGFSGLFVPGLAFDGNLSTFWKAQSPQFLAPGADAAQWLGMQFTSPTAWSPNFGV